MVELSFRIVPFRAVSKCRVSFETVVDRKMASGQADPTAIANQFIP